MFICKGCLILKPIDGFRVHKKGNREGKCRICERAYMRERYLKNPDKVREQKRLSMAKARAKDPQAARDYRNSYHEANREEQTAKMRAYAKRRFFWTKAMKLRGDSRATPLDIASLWKKQRGLCALTGRRLDRTSQLDHKLPKARGGSDEICNLQWLCESANLAKRDLTDGEFAALCADVMKWIGERIAAVESIKSKESK